MSQDNILTFLSNTKNKKRWYSTKFLRNVSGSNASSTSQCIKRIIKFKEAHNVELKVGRRNKFFLRKKGCLYL